MDQNLDPAIRRQLATFRNRWRGLLLARGFCLTLVVLLVGMLLMVGADLAFALNETARAWAGGVVYGTEVEEGATRAGRRSRPAPAAQLQLALARRLLLLLRRGGG